MNKIKTFLKLSIAMLSIVMLAGALNSCQDESIIEHGLDAEQLVAGRIAGTWSLPTDIVTPGNVPTAIFGNMRLRFTTTKAGYPDKFIATGCPIIFSSEASTWSVTLTNEATDLTLSDVVPVDVFNVEVNSSTLTISFYMGWENTETGESGEGEFRANLKRL